MVGAGRKNECVETETIALARQKHVTSAEKERADTELEFSSCFFVVLLTCLSAGSRLVTSPLERTTKTGARNISPLHILAARVRLSLPHHVSPSTPKKQEWSPSSRLSCRGQKHNRFWSFHIVIFSCAVS